MAKALALALALASAPPFLPGVAALRPLSGWVNVSVAPHQHRPQSWPRYRPPSWLRRELAKVVVGSLGIGLAMRGFRCLCRCNCRRFCRCWGKRVVGELPQFFHLLRRGCNWRVGPSSAWRAAAGVGACRWTCCWTGGLRKMHPRESLARSSFGLRRSSPFGLRHHVWCQKQEGLCIRGPWRPHLLRGGVLCVLGPRPWGEHCSH